jgi:Lanthionine synthetase C-like protein
LRGDAARRALDAASRILDRGVAQLQETQQPHAPGSVDAYGGAVLIADALARAGRDPRPPVEELLRRAMVLRADELSLYGGAAGLLVVLDAVDDDRRLQRPRARLCDVLSASIDARAPLNLDDVPTYDLISGFAGRALALRDRNAAARRDVRAWFVRLIGAVERRLVASDPGGTTLNLGVAHGVPGVLAALNAALPEDHELARRYVEALLVASHDCGGARRWDTTWRRRAVPPAVCSWCYYTVGVAAVLYDRAVLDRDSALRTLALDALARVLEDYGDAWSGVAPSLCHGRAGVATVAWHLAPDDERFARVAEHLAHSVLAEYDERLPLGYRAYERGDGLSDHRTQFLDASFGIALFLVDAATANARPWLPLLGLLPD